MGTYGYAAPEYLATGINCAFKQMFIYYLKSAFVLLLNSVLGIKKKQFDLFHYEKAK